MNSEYDRVFHNTEPSEARFINYHGTEELSRINYSSAGAGSREDLIRLNSSEFENLVSGTGTQHNISWKWVVFGELCYHRSLSFHILYLFLLFKILGTFNHPLYTHRLEQIHVEVSVSFIFHVAFFLSWHFLKPMQNINDSTPPLLN